MRSTHLGGVDRIVPAQSKVQVLEHQENISDINPEQDLNVSASSQEKSYTIQCQFPDKM